MNTLKLDGKKRPGVSKYYMIARNIAFISACFSIIVAVIISANFLQLRKHDPINSPQLLELIEQSQAESDNKELADTIRAYDLLIRKAHFTGLAFGKFGSYLLLGGVCLFLAALKFMYELKRKLPGPGKFKEIEDKPKAAVFIQYSILGVAVVIVVVSFMLPRILKYGRTAGTGLPSVSVGEPASEEKMARNWPSFRGYRGLGIAHNAQPITDWDGASGRNILWKTPIPRPGVNSPVVWEGLVFLTGADDDEREVYCLDINTGKIIWKRVTGAGTDISIPEVGEDTGLAAPTMATDGRFAAALFATGELMILDFEGNVVWERKLETPDNVYGHASSLITHKGLLFVQYDHSGGARVIAFNMASGEKVWEQKREVESSWSSPVIVNSSQGDQLILTADPYISAYEPETGRQLWQMKDVINGDIGSSCAFYNDRLYAVNQFAVLASVDINSREILWKYEDNLPDASSPAAYGDYLILPSSYEKVSCLDAATGRLYWEHRFKKGFYSSPVINNDKVYMIDKKGVMRIFALDKTFRSISNPELGEACTATPAFAGNRILIRGEKNLYCIGEK